LLHITGVYFENAWINAKNSSRIAVKHVCLSSNELLGKLNPTSLFKIYCYFNLIEIVLVSV